MALSLRDLQNELEALQRLCPVLLPSSTPQGYDIEDLWGLVGTEGKAEREALKQCLQAAASQHAAASSSCCVCQTAGDPSVSSSTQDDEAHALRFTVFSRLDFPGKLIQLTRGGFACGHCRALLQPHRFLQFAALRLSPQHPERMVLAQELCAHFATTNRAPEHVQANPDALVLWLQELMSRAYALQVLASNIGGWKMVGPGGEQIRQCTKGTSVKLAEALLAASRGERSSRLKEKAATKKEGSNKRSKASPSPAADVLPLSQGVEAAAAAADRQQPAQQQPQTPASSGKKRKGANAAASGSDTGTAAGERGVSAALSSSPMQPEVGGSTQLTPAARRQHSNTACSSKKKKKDSVQAQETTQPGTPAAGSGGGVATGVAEASKDGKKSAKKLSGQQAHVQEQGAMEGKRKAAMPGPVKQVAEKKARPSL